MTRLLHRIDATARQALPVALALVLVLVSALPASLPVFRETAPAWVLIAVFHWSVHRPNLMPVQAVFLIGLLQDLLLGSPLGIGALIYVLIRGTAGRMAQLAAGRGFIGLWLTFALAAAAAFLVRYVIMVLWHAQLIAPVPSLLQWLVTVGVYPLVAWAFVRVQKGLLGHV